MIRRAREADGGRDDNLWTWIVIGLIYAAIAVALYGPLVWEGMQRAV